MRTRITFLLVFMLAVWILASCSNRDQVLSPLDGADGDGPRTPDELAARLAKVYADRDLAAYADLLDEDFVFSMRPCDVNELGGGPSETMWGRDEELTIAGRMFGGKACRNSQGIVVPAVTAVTVERCERLTPWEDAGEEDRPRVQRAVYALDVTFALEDGRLLKVTGPAILYAAPAAGASGCTIYKLRAWVDHG